MTEWKERLIFNFIENDRWKYLWDGLGVTLRVTFLALVLGICIGVLVSIIRSTYGNPDYFGCYFQSISDSNSRYTCRCAADADLLCCDGILYQ